MNENRKKLKERARAVRPEMGVYLIKNEKEHRFLMEACANLTGGINGARFRLESGNHPNRGLQQSWNENGPDAFQFEILDRLEYDKDGLKTDYSSDLKELLDLWKEKYRKESGFTQY